MLPKIVAVMAHLQSQLRDWLGRENVSLLPDGSISLNSVAAEPVHYSAAALHATGRAPERVGPPKDTRSDHDTRHRLPPA